MVPAASDFLQVSRVGYKGPNGREAGRRLVMSDNLNPRAVKLAR